MTRALLTGGAVLAVVRRSAAAQQPNDWPTVGNDPGGMKYSPLTQITPANVSQLAKSWTYDTGAPANGYTITPIVDQQRHVLCRSRARSSSRSRPTPARSCGSST